MKIGVFSDAHGNEIGFNKCLKFLEEKSDMIFFLGDSVGYFPASNKIVDSLRKHPKIHALLGNHDAMFLGYLPYDEKLEEVYLLRDAKEIINAENVAYLGTLVPFNSINIDGRSILLTHGTPQNPLNGYFYPDMDMEQFSKFDYDVIFMGHTHRCFYININGKKIINVGSCGMSRDIGNKITAVIYDTTSDVVEIFDMEMDMQKVLRKYEDHIHISVKEVLNRKVSK